MELVVDPDDQSFQLDMSNGESNERSPGGSRPGCDPLAWAMAESEKVSAALGSQALGVASLSEGRDRVGG